MKTFTQNIIGTFAEAGKIWLNRLPSIIDILAAQWNLTSIKPVQNMTYNYVAKATANSNQNVVLKIGCDKQTIIDEKNALQHFNGQGSILCLDFNQEHNAMLLQQAIPGITLKRLYPAEADVVIDAYATTMQILHQNPLLPTHPFKQVSDWLTAIDNLTAEQLPLLLLNKAILLKTELLNSSQKQILLHGDLHLDNILEDNHSWLTIDPKGIIGEPEFEAAAFDFIHPSELKITKDIPALFAMRTEQLAQSAKLDEQRIRDWVFVRLILSAAWSIEDSGDPNQALMLAKKICM